MTMVAVNGRLWDVPIVGAAGSYSGLAMTLSTDKVAVIFRAPKAGDLEWFEFMLGTVTQAPASGLRCSFQTVDPTNGDPDGTVDQFANITAGIASNAWMTPPNRISSDGTGTGTRRTVTKGELVAAVVDWVSFGAGDSLNINTLTGVGPTVVGSPYVDRNTATAWTRSSNYAVFALKYSDGTYAYVGASCWPIAAVHTSITLNTGTTPDEVGNKITHAFPVRIVGARVMANTGAAGRDFDIVLYGADGTTPKTNGTISVDADTTRIATSIHVGEYFFPADHDLTANEVVYLTFKPTTAGNTTAYEILIGGAPTVAMMDSLPEGQTCFKITKVDNGAPSEVTTRRIMIAPIYAGFDNAAGAGGGLRIAGGGLAF